MPVAAAIAAAAVIAFQVLVALYGAVLEFVSSPQVVPATA